MSRFYVMLTAVAGIFLSLASCKKDEVKPAETVQYQTDFSSDDGKWSLTGLPGVSVSINNGYLNILSEPSTTGIDLHLANVFTSSQKNTAIEASFKPSRYNTADNYGAGLIWGKSGSGTTRITHYFVISPLGGYKITGYPDGIDKPVVTYVDWTTNSLTDPNGFTRLRIERKEGQYRFLVKMVPKCIPCRPQPVLPWMLPDWQSEPV